MGISEYLIIISLVSFCLILWNYRNNTRWKLPNKLFPKDWRLILEQYVTFYSSLSAEEKNKFEYKIQEFLLNCRITGIKTTIDTTDKLLVASSAIIPIFGFDEWKYTNINEVLLYPSTFNEKFETEGPDRRILGMVGSGYMEGVMILSKKALKHGFRNESDKKNTAIHEFIHLIDKADGVIDGIPSLLLERQYSIPWLDLINKKIGEIHDGNSDINPYGGTNRAEFFSVASEYFFERPKLLSKKHPELYKLLERIFKQDMTLKILRKNKVQIGRNSPCPCNSGKKFKQCCGRVHYNLTQKVYP